MNLHDALGAVVADARDDVEEASWRGVYVNPTRVLLDHTEDVSLHQITSDDVRTLIRSLLDAGYEPTTITGKHLPMLARVFRANGLRCPVKEAKRRMRARLRRRSPEPPVFEPEHIRRNLRRIAEYRSTKPLPRRAEDLAVFRLVASRGIRAYELARVRIERDVDLHRGLMTIHSKDKANPRYVQLGPQQLEDVRTLMGERVSGLLVRGGKRQLNHACEAWKLRLREPNWNLRVLRRSFASALDDMGAPFAVLRDGLGHAHDSSETARYLRSATRRLQTELRRLDEHLLPPPSSVSDHPKSGRSTDSPPPAA